MPLAILVLALGGMAFGLYKLITQSQTNRAGAAPKLTPLTSLPGSESQPTFSPDGNQIAFVWRNEKDSDIYVKMVNAETKLQLTNDPADEISPAWSPGGKFVYYLKGRGTPGIWRVPIEGGEEVLVLAHHKAGLGRAWTVVEKGIYFATAEDAAKPQIEFYNFATRAVTPVVALARPFRSVLSVSPDGRWLLYSQVDQLGSDIMLMENFR